VIAKVLAALAVAALLAATPAAAQVSQPVGPWDGENPFACQNQNVGTGTEFPHPDADPFCVEFDKTSQNLTDFGLVDFLANEPARTAAAAPKCFYFQQDHWTGSIVQGSDPELWHWDGHYFFDKAKGIGGVSVHNFRIGGQPFDFSPYVPPEYSQWVYPGGGGGVIVLLETDPDPQCIAMVDSPSERRHVYAGASSFPQCITPGGTIRGRHVGRVRLGTARKALHRKVGKPRRIRRHVDRWCVVGAANLRVAYRWQGAGKNRARRTALILTTSRGHTISRVGRGSKIGQAKRALGLRARFRVQGARVFEAGRANKRRAFLGAKRGRVKWVALADPRRLGTRAIRRTLRRTL
jgi:hypothetical protein